MQSISVYNARYTLTCGHMHTVRAYLGDAWPGRSVNVNCVRLIENRWYAWSATKAISATTMRAENTHTAHIRVSRGRLGTRMQYTRAAADGAGKKKASEKSSHVTALIKTSLVGRNLKCLP